MASDDDEQDTGYALTGTRAQMIQRLQVGLSGLAAMVLLVGLANIIMERAKQTEAASVPEAAATVAAVPTPAANDPLADAGVVPEVAVRPKRVPAQPIVIDPSQVPAPPKQ